MDDKISWLGGWACQWRPSQRLSEHKHCDNVATTVIRTARTLEAEWWKVCRERGYGDKGRWVKYWARLGCWISPCYGPFSLGARFKIHGTFISLIFQIFFRPRPTTDTESAVTAVHLNLIYQLQTHGYSRTPHLNCPPPKHMATLEHHTYTAHHPNTRLLSNTTPTLPTTQKSISQSPPCHQPHR